MITDEDLMLRYRDGSPDAFEELFGRYRQAIWAFFRRRLSDKGRAEDLAQETFVAVMKAASRYEPRAPFRTYLYGIAFNLLSAERRRTHTRDAAPLDDMTVGAAVPGDPEATLWVQKALGRLDPEDREILWLREFEQLSYGEIAHLLVVPLNTVRSRLFRARLQLRRLLQPEAEARGTLT